MFRTQLYKNKLTLVDVVFIADSIDSVQVDSLESDGETDNKGEFVDRMKAVIPGN